MVGNTTVVHLGCVRARPRFTSAYAAAAILNVTKKKKKNYNSSSSSFSTSSNVSLSGQKSGKLSTEILQTTLAALHGAGTEIEIMLHSMCRADSKHHRAHWTGFCIQSFSFSIDDKNNVKSKAALRVHSFKLTRRCLKMQMLQAPHSPPPQHVWLK